MTQRKKLINCEVSEFMTKTSSEKSRNLCKLHCKKIGSGEKYLQAFTLNKSPKALSDLIVKTWKTQDFPETATHEHCTRMFIICNYVAVSV